MARPIDLSDNNTPIPADYDGKAGKGNCACGGKGCNTPKEENMMNESCCDTDKNCCTKPSCCAALLKLLLALVLAGGIALAGYAVGCGIKSISAAQRFITVRGFSEREVKADLAIWNIGYVATGNDIAEVQDKVERDSNSLRLFLITSGIEESEIIELPTSMTDLLSRDYRPDNAKDNRYIVNAGLRIRTDKVDIVQRLSGMKIGAVIKSGVTLSDNSPPVYLYTQLQAIKPEMVAAATDDARKAAVQFAKDSGAQLGNMKTASQGLFQFLPRDQADNVRESSEINKIVRVVTSVSYFLKD